MLPCVEKQIRTLGFVNLGDHYSLCKKGRTYTLTEHSYGDHTVIEILGEIKIRLLDSSKREKLSEIDVTDNVQRIEVVDLGDKTSILLSFHFPETEESDMAVNIKEVIETLETVKKRVS